MQRIASKQGLGLGLGLGLEFLHADDVAVLGLHLIFLQSSLFYLMPLAPKTF